MPLSSPYIGWLGLEVADPSAQLHTQWRILCGKSSPLPISDFVKATASSDLNTLGSSPYSAKEGALDPCTVGASQLKKALSL